MMRKHLQQLKCLICRPVREEENEVMVRDALNLRRQDMILHRDDDAVKPPPPPPRPDPALEHAVARGAAAARASGDVFDRVETSSADRRLHRRPPLAAVAQQPNHPAPPRSDSSGPVPPPPVRTHHADDGEDDEVDALITPSQIARIYDRLSFSAASTTTSSSASSSRENDNRIVHSPQEDDEYDDDNFDFPTRDARRVSKTFRNIHPAHETIKARMDIFEGRRASDDGPRRPPVLLPSWSDDDGTRNDGKTPSPASNYHVRRGRSSVLSAAAAVRDCQHDPQHAYAYKIWYQHGLLAFRPKGMDDDDE